MSCIYLKKITSDLYYCPFAYCKKYGKCLRAVNIKKEKEIPEIFKAAEHTPLYLHQTFKVEKKAILQMLDDHTPLYGIARYLQVPISEVKLMLRNEKYSWTKGYEGWKYVKGAI